MARDGLDSGPRTGKNEGRMAGRKDPANADRKRDTSSQARVGPYLGSCPLDFRDRSRRLYLSAQGPQVGVLGPALGASCSSRTG